MSLQSLPATGALGRFRGGEGEGRDVVLGVRERVDIAGRFGLRAGGDAAPQPAPQPIRDGVPDRVAARSLLILSASPSPTSAPGPRAHDGGRQPSSAAASSCLLLPPPSAAAWTAAARRYRRGAAAMPKGPCRFWSRHR